MLLLNRFLICTLFALVYLPGALAAGSYQSQEDFLAEAFQGEPPDPAVLWLRGDLKQQVATVLGHTYPSLRIRYWKKGPRSAWILEEIGKEKPITAGFVIQDRHIERVKVLAFRESRGWEIRREFFTRQFDQANLDDKQRLSRPIDGISGATLSVRAMKKMARLALLLDRQIP